MKQIVAILTAVLIGCGINCFSQGKVSRSKTRTTVSKQTKRETQATSPLTGVINGHEWVDLGLPSGIKWATCNLGAISSEDIGEYFAWGEITPKDKYNEDNSLTINKSIFDLQSKGIITGSGVLNEPYDAAKANWGESWRLPTKEECTELLNFGKWEFISESKRIGYKVIGPNGNFIFLPFTGWKYGDNLQAKNKFGIYWNSSADSHNEYAGRLHINPENRFVDGTLRYHGHNIRPVTN